ncbi:MAG TPA: malto-oligosyltrehalose synthase [Propionibacteriaceae bacterium]|nr:malto-oligosyltrehalose synthase [Propionibacteriaceae bacterium]
MIPASTYRLQVNRSFTLDDVARLIDYLSELGVGAVYLSPILQSTIGSDHGYDTTDVTRVDQDRGGPEALERLLTSARSAGLEVIIDIVPNHLGIEHPIENPAWWDVLRLGPKSPYASWFDIDWSRGRIVVPILGDDAQLTVADDELHYFEHRFPLAPGSWSEGEDAEAVHDRQHYQLVHYSSGNTEINYRRFFAITTLAGVRVEDAEVFSATHALVKDWCAAGIAGLRIDHPDGLRDPLGYLHRLRSFASKQWITVEKILEAGEELPKTWPVAGTTGYDAMREVNGVFIDHDHEPEFTAHYQRLTGDQGAISDHIEAGKRLVVNTLLPAEVRRMAALTRDIPNAGQALAEVAIAFEVYRSYLPEGVADLDHALATAAQRRPELADTIDQLSPRLHDHGDDLALRMQQLSSAAMAKGVEDTAYYRYSRFIALNEVGGNPDQFGIPLQDFHSLQVARLNHQPASMTGLSTHDTKRGEDVRARLAVLSEIPKAWAGFAELFLSRTTIPNRLFGYFLAQTLVGTGPIERARMHAYAEKAMREASDGTTWTAPDPSYEAAVHQAVDSAYDDRQLRHAWDQIDAKITGPGWSNSLGQKLVQLTMPGVPDVYQGTEFWEDSLVDPDNRRPVDFEQRMRLLESLGDAPPGIDETGAAKLWITRQALRLRRNQPSSFTDYRALEASGPAHDHLIGFDRGGAITFATRLPIGLSAGGGWRQSTVEISAPHIDILTGQRWSGTVAVEDLLALYPVALLAADDHK